MNLQDEDFLKLLRETFRAEAEEHLSAMADDLQKLRTAVPGVSRQAVIEHVFREAHSLKGAARAVNEREIESICQSAEDVFSKWKRCEESPDGETISRMLTAVDSASNILTGTAPEAPSSIGTPPLTQVDISPRELSESPTRFPSPTEMSEPQSHQRQTGAEIFRVPAARLDSLIARVEEFIPAKLSSAHQLSALRNMESMFEGWHGEWASVRSRLRDIQVASSRDQPPDPYDLSRILTFLSWNSQFMRLAEDKITTLTRDAARDRQDNDKRLGELLADTKQLSMTPCSTLLGPIAKLVRDLARELGKEADFVTRGAEIEMDRQVLDKLKDSLTHIIRNCMDHGVEPPELRRQRNKPPRATITFSITRVESDRATITISDDGGGMNIERLKAVALARSLITADQALRMTDDEAARLIFVSGISTAAKITELSGRGLGMAIVHETIANLGGRVALSTRDSAGTAFFITLPISRATFRATLVELQGQLYAIPTCCIEHTMLAENSKHTSDANEPRGDRTKQEPVPIDMADALGLSRQNGANCRPPLLVVIRDGGTRVEFLVDAIFADAEVTVRPLGPSLRHVRTISGVTILEHGMLAPIVNVADTATAALRLLASASSTPTPRPTVSFHERRKRILVVDDSITSRLLIKSFLELSQFEVATAVDGVDALVQLSSSAFDLIVSDVDMPRMSGLELTRRIRASKNTHLMPVILMTALGTLQDRERGLQVGANDYIIKSSFHHGDLLASVKQLINIHEQKH